MNNKPQSMAEAIHNLSEALHALAVAIAAVMAPVIRILQEEGMVDKKGRLTYRGKRLLAKDWERRNGKA